MTATIKKLHQGLDNVDFIGTENIIVGHPRAESADIEKSYAGTLCRTFPPFLRWSLSAC